jgi:hypothetical protein
MRQGKSKKVSHCGGRGEVRRVPRIRVSLRNPDSKPDECLYNRDFSRRVLLTIKNHKKDRQNACHTGDDSIFEFRNSFLQLELSQPVSSSAQA